MNMLSIYIYIYAEYFIKENTSKKNNNTFSQEMINQTIRTN